MKRPPCPRLFVFGDRVKFITPSEHNPENFQHGVVVYHKGTYAKTLVRVRWASGWGGTTPAKKLVKLTPEECAKWPVPALCNNYGDSTPPRAKAIVP